ncbi:MAG: sugar transferase, partial [Anaerolineae bacterium]|nr:sugar transferase [Anaerolineae bacterium]
MSRNGRVPGWVVLLDIATIIIAFLGGYWVRYDLRWFLDVAYDAPLSAYLPFLILYVVLTPLFFVVDGVYRTWPRSWMDQVYRITNATAKVTVLMLAVTFVFRPRYYSRAMLIEVGLLTILLLALVRGAEGLAIAYLRAKGVGIRRVVIVGAGEVGRTVMRTIVARPDLGYRVVGFVDDNPNKGYTDIGRFKALGPLDNLPAILDEERPDEVIITLPWMYHRKIMGIVRECERRNVRARIVPDLFQMSLTQVNVEDLGGVPLIGVRTVSISKGALLVKRLIDVTVAVVGLLLCAPLFGLIALAIRLDSPGPVIFRQTRVGLRGRHFEMYKFRSMHVGAQEQQDML